MIIHEVEQGSPAWHELRAGIPTASEFSKIVTPAKWQPSEQAAGYMNRLVAELLLGHPLDSVGTEAMERGSDLEEKAALAYELKTGFETVKVGFVTNDEGTFGASPDRFVGEDGLLEIKCPLPGTHVGYCLSRSIEKEKLPQIMGQLLVTGRKWCDIMSYCPGLPRIIIRVERDEEKIAILKAALEEFHVRKLDARAKLEQEPN